MLFGMPEVEHFRIADLAHLGTGDLGPVELGHFVFGKFGKRGSSKSKRLGGRVPWKPG